MYVLENLYDEHPHDIIKHLQNPLLLQSPNCHFCIPYSKHNAWYLLNKYLKSSVLHNLQQFKIFSVYLAKRLYPPLSVIFIEN